MIYAIRAVGTEFVKIGFTDDESPKQRLTTLQIGCPHKLEVEAFGVGSEDDEKVIHKYLAEHHVRGEWFKLNPMVQAVIEEIGKRKPGVRFFQLLDLAVAERDGLAAQVMTVAFKREQLPTDEHKRLWDMCQALAKRMPENEYGRQERNEAQAS